MHMHMHMHMRMCWHIADVRRKKTFVLLSSPALDVRLMTALQVLQVHARRVEQLFHHSSSSATEVYPYLTPHLGAPPPAAVP